jgi:hypothetical protein
MHRIAVLALGLVCFSVIAAAQDVTYNFDQGANFTKFKTYKWVDLKGGVELDQLLDQQIRSAFDAELAKKGLSPTGDDTADLYVGYQAALGQEKQINSYTSGGYGWGYPSRWGGGMGMTTSTTSTITTGTLLLDMYDSGARQLVWRGKASKTIDGNAKPEKRQKNLGKAAAKMLKNYPPPVKK